ncbi:MAG: isopentenyl phosphate kinase [Haloarculaceae archaeon]
MTTVLKLGGSVVTVKDETETVADANLARAADAIAGHDDLVLVHGGGSFGHPNASAHGVSTTTGTHDAAAARAIHDAMKGLNAAILDALHDRDVPALAVHPFSAAHRDADGDLHLPTGQVRTMLGEGFVPVLHGDLVAHAGQGVTVASGDELVASLAVGLDASRVGLCSAVPGVLDDRGEVIPHVESFEAVAAVVGESDATDVTGGMAGKVRQLLALDAPASIFDLDGVGPFLDGGTPGTLVD